MESKSALDKNGFIYQINSNLQNFWANLSESQQGILKKIWTVLTYKWQWQIILNAPFLILWFLDQTFPSVHAFDMQLISSLPIPNSLKTLFGFS